ncbi:hypothetical protein C8R45DRAFT_1224528, partial [Mycena sanguinolenta]
MEKVGLTRDKTRVVLKFRPQTRDPRRPLPSTPILPMVLYHEVPPLAHWMDEEDNQELVISDGLKYVCVASNAQAEEANHKKSRTVRKIKSEAALIRNVVTPRNTPVPRCDSVPPVPRCDSVPPVPRCDFVPSCVSSIASTPVDNNAKITPQLDLCDYVVVSAPPNDNKVPPSPSNLSDDEGLNLLYPDDTESWKTAQSRLEPLSEHRYEVGEGSDSGGPPSLVYP